MLFQDIKKILQKSGIFADEDTILTATDINRVIESMGKASNIWDLAFRSGYNLRFLVGLVRVMSEMGLVEVDGGNVKAKFDAIEKKDSSVIEERMSPVPIFFQMPIDKKTLEQRVKYIEMNSSYSDRIAFIGDDDFNSVASARNHFFKDVTVFEIDKRIVNKLNSLSEERNLDLNAIEFDIRKVPNGFLGIFDIVFTDTPYSVDGFSVFLSRAIQLVKKERGKRILVSFSPLLPDVKTEMKVQQIITESGLYMEEKTSFVNHEIPDELRKRYDTIDKIENALDSNDDSIDKWYLENLARRESIFNLITTDFTKPLIDKDFNDEL